MTRQEIAAAIDVQALIDRLEKVGTVADYYRLNHTSPEERQRLADRLALALAQELEELGVKVEF